MEDTMERGGVGKQLELQLHMSLRTSSTLLMERGSRGGQEGSTEEQRGVGKQLHHTA